MKKNDLISIIVPVYNVEKYIERCIKSILTQTYTNIEILLIDDGSTDFSSKICDKYSEKYRNVRTFHKKNGGLADARNFGLKQASGKYVLFVDGDDLINQYMVEIMYKSIKDNNVKVAVCKFKNVNEYFNLKELKQERFKEKEILLSKEEALKAMVSLNFGFEPNVCNKMFDIELFTEDCYFPVGKLYEDMIVTVKILSKINMVSFNDIELYYYVQRNNSITNKFNDKELDHIEMSNKVLNFINENCKSTYNYFLTYHIINCLSVINKMIKNNCLDEKIYNNTKKVLQQNKKVIFHDDNLSIKKKMQLFLFMYSIKIYSIIYKIGG